jgi:hypothetical protein
MSERPWWADLSPEQGTVFELFEACRANHDHPGIRPRTCVFRQLRARGWTNRQIGYETGLSIGYISSIINARPEATDVRS